MKRGLVVLLAAIAFSGTTAATSSPSRSGPYVWVMNANGTEIRRLTDEVSYAQEPTWSPDGTRVASGTYGSIVIANVDGSGYETISAGAADDPYWSPNGDEIFYAGISDGVHGIHALDLESRETRLVADVELTDRAPVPSPDGSQVAFFNGRDPENPGRLFVVDADGSDLRLLTEYASWVVGRPDWSRDGSHLAYPSWDGELHIVSVDGQKDRALGVAHSFSSVPAWSPMRDEVAFSGRDGLHVASLQGDVRRVYRGEASQLDWSPDGAEIIFTDGLEVRKVLAAGGAVTTLSAPHLSDPEFARHSGSGERIAFVSSEWSAGGPTNVATSVTIEYEESSRREAFTGRVRANYWSCFRRRLVRVFEETKEGWRKVGQDRAGWRGRYKVVHPDAHGRFFASVATGLVPDHEYSECARARSPVIRVRRTS